jgi:hypothetical protein
MEPDGERSPVGIATSRGRVFADDQGSVIDLRRMRLGLKALPI